MENPTNCVIGAFDDVNSARMTVDELKMAGFDDDEVRLLESDARTPSREDTETRHLVIVTSADDVDEAAMIMRRNGGETLREEAGRERPGRGTPEEHPSL